MFFAAKTEEDVCRRRTLLARVFPFSDEIFNSTTLSKSTKRSGEANDEARGKSEKEGKGGGEKGKKEHAT